MAQAASTGNARALVAVLGFLCVQVALAQWFSVSGAVVDDADGKALAGALVGLVQATDSTRRHAVMADGEGRFNFGNVKAGEYLLRVGFLGYAPVERAISVHAELRGMVVPMQAISTPLKSVEKVAVRPRVEFKGDTTIYYAGAYTVGPDATAEDLLKKMPGINRRNGEWNAQGEAVLRILLDGTEFFGENAARALKSLPAGIIDQVQVLDKKSDQAEFTGFDDGKSKRTLNIVTKKGMDRGVFGDASLGAGTDNRFQGDLSLNRFHGPQRISLMGHRDNTYAQDGRPGITISDLAGLDFHDELGRTKLGGSYYFYQQHNATTSQFVRTTYLGDSAAQVTNSDGHSAGRHYNHDVRFRVESQLGPANSLTITPGLGMAGSTLDNAQQSRVLNGDSLQLGASNNSSTSGEDGLDFNNSLLYRHRFAKPRRTFSADLTTRIGIRSSAGTLVADDPFLPDTAAIASSTHQRYTGDGHSQRHALQLNYTEPVGEKGMLQVALSPSIALNDAGKLTHDLDPNSGLELLNAPLSIEADNALKTLVAGVSYGVRSDGLAFTFGLDAQGLAMHSGQRYPFGATVDRRYTNLLPHAQLSRNWGHGTRLNIDYRSQVSTPSFSQLQAVVDNRDPLNLTTGNMDLGQGRQHALSIRLNMLDSTRTRPFFVLLRVMSEPGRISNVTYVPAGDSTLADGVLLPAGAQFSLPRNLDGHVSASSRVSYGRPIDVLGSNLSMDAGGSIERLPGEVNGRKSLTWNADWDLGAELNSNVSGHVDIGIGCRTSYHSARNNLRSAVTNSYYQGALTGAFSLKGPKGWVLHSEVNYQRFVGLGAAYDRDPLVWNAALGHKFLKKDALECLVSVNDMLGRNVSVTREVGSTYIQNTVSDLLQRYVLLTVQYNLRAFGDPTAE